MIVHAVERAVFIGKAGIGGGGILPDGRAVRVGGRRKGNVIKGHRARHRGGVVNRIVGDEEGRTGNILPRRRSALHVERIEPHALIGKKQRAVGCELQLGKRRRGGVGARFMLVRKIFVLRFIVKVQRGTVRHRRVFLGKSGVRRRLQGKILLVRGGQKQFAVFRRHGDGFFVFPRVLFGFCKKGGAARRKRGGAERAGKRKTNGFLSCVHIPIISRAREKDNIFWVFPKNFGK